MQTRANYRTARLVAIVAGILGAALAILTPLLPVRQTTAQLNWPQNDTLSSVTAPLIGYVATDLTITVPCRAAAGLTGGEKTVLLSTVPKQAPKAVDRGLLIQRANNDLVVVVRNTPVVVAPMAQVLSPACRELRFTAHADKVTGEATVGEPGGKVQAAAKLYGAIADHADALGMVGFKLPRFRLTNQLRDGQLTTLDLPALLVRHRALANALVAG